MDTPTPTCPNTDATSNPSAFHWQAVHWEGVRGNGTEVIHDWHCHACGCRWHTDADGNIVGKISTPT